MEEHAQVGDNGWNANKNKLIHTLDNKNFTNSSQACLKYFQMSAFGEVMYHFLFECLLSKSRKE